jgi:hypothetical protein
VIEREASHLRTVTQRRSYSKSTHRHTEDSASRGPEACHDEVPLDCVPEVDVIRWRLLPLLLLLACAGKRPAESAAYYFDEAESSVRYKKDSGIDFDEEP